MQELNAAGNRLRHTYAGRRQLAHGEKSLYCLTTDRRCSAYRKRIKYSERIWAMSITRLQLHDAVSYSRTPLEPFRDLEIGEMRVAFAKTHLLFPNLLIDVSKRLIIIMENTKWCQYYTIRNASKLYKKAIVTFNIKNITRTHRSGWKNTTQTELNRKFVNTIQIYQGQTCIIYGGNSLRNTIASHRIHYSFNRKIAAYEFMSRTSHAQRAIEIQITAYGSDFAARQLGCTLEWQPFGLRQFSHRAQRQHCLVVHQWGPW